MKPKRNTIYPLVALLTLFFTITSCIRENYVVDEQGTIVVSVDGATTRAGDLFDDSDEIVTKVRIIVFVNDYMEKNMVFTSGNADYKNPFELEVATGAKTVYVVANESGGLATNLSGTLTKTSLEAMLANEINGSLTPPITMVGKTTGVSVVANTANSATVTLTRIAAKINLKFNKGASTTEEVKITKISLINNTKKTPLFEGGATITDQSYWDYSFTPTSAMTLSTTSTSVTGAENIYVYENLTGGSKTKATQLEVEALFGGVPTKYRVYVNENVNSVVNPGDPSSSVTDPADHLYNIKRNYEYNLNGTITSIGEYDGFTMKTNVLPWNYLPSTVTYKYEFTITPKPLQESGGIYNVTGINSDVSFEFKLINPINATWTATLTGTEFEISGNNSGNTGETKTITIKPKQNQDTTSRQTELYISVNGQEIPLLSWLDGAVGIGNRIVIQQPAVTP